MKALKIVGLGLSIWALSLLWPQINLIFSAPLAVGLMVVGLGIVGVAIITLVFIFEQRIRYQASHGRGERDDHARISRPLSPLLKTAVQREASHPSQ